MRTILDSAADAFGCTPLVRLDRIASALGLDGTIFAELGYLDPGDSKRAPIAELTSSNAGTELSIVCANKGYRFVAAMHKGLYWTCRKMAALGAEVLLIYQMPDSVPREVSRPYLQPVGEKRNWDGALGQSNGNLDGFGTEPIQQCFTVEPHEAAVLADQPVSRPVHPIQGKDYVMTSVIARKEGLFGWFSRGANISAAFESLKAPVQGQICHETGMLSLCPVLLRVNLTFAQHTDCSLFFDLDELIQSTLNPLHPDWKATSRGPQTDCLSFQKWLSSEKWLPIHNSHEWPPPPQEKTWRTFFDCYLKKANHD
ncbi:cystathionine beta-synthase [Colletotrichum lupini]|uniref:Cystathionine beta-synthase n=1 Tax=Colletotrichum lupini TaxID=145971 RepID=A0A9Q8WG64_9PEZI|nr:cystathionine beta-synthase [Colletotrichum lupini]UQC81607.1 cystathionine beta-synthase [Colletotrichum lupini]